MKKNNQPFNIKVKNYILLEPVGIGAYSQVIKSKKIGTDKLFAIKLYSEKKLRLNQNLKNFIQNELENLKILKDHKNVIKIIETFKEDEYLYVVYNFCQKGNLRNILDKKKITEKQALKYLKDLISIINYMKKKKIIHRDIKSENILFDKEENLKLADFGFSRILDFNMKIKGQIGSPVYMAPEMLENKLYCYKADIWSLGCVFYEILFNDCPFIANSITGILNKIYKGLNFCDMKISDFSKNVLVKMLERNPNKRISIEELFLLFENFDNEEKICKNIIQKNLQIKDDIIQNKILVEKKLPIEIRSLSDSSIDLKNNLTKIYKKKFLETDFQKKIFKVNFFLHVLKMTIEREYDFNKKLSHKSINYIINKLNFLIENLLEEIKKNKTLKKKIQYEIFLKNVKSFISFLIKTNEIKLEEKKNEISILRYF